MTEAELYDYLQQTFGIGDWDEATSEVPWWKFRATEIAKLKSMMRKRRTIPEHVRIAADYAREIHAPVRTTQQVFALIPEAMHHHRLAQKQQAQGHDLEDAIDEAVAAEEFGWAERLSRASGKEAQTVINEWRNR